jgi:formamidase
LELSLSPKVALAVAKSIEIDRKKHLCEEPGRGHNRWHPDIAPVIEAAAGEEVTLETRDANDLQIHAGTTAKEIWVPVPD